MKPAVSIERVSTSRQTTKHLAVSCDRVAEENGLAIVHRFTLKASASDGSQQSVLDDTLRLAREGQITAVITAALDRIDRRGVVALADDFIKPLARLGVTIYSGRAGEEWLSSFDPSDMASRIRLDMEADRARQEAQAVSQRCRDGHAMVDASGGVRVNVPRGWDIIKESKYAARITVNLEAQQLVRTAIEEIAEGATVAETARKHGLAYGTVEGWLRQDAYVTGLVSAGGGRLIEVEPFVDADTMDRARRRHATRQRAVRGKGQGSRSPKLAAAAQTFSGRIACVHKYWLYIRQGPERKDGTRRLYYRASRCPVCRNSLYDQVSADDAVSAFLAQRTQTMPVYRSVGANDVARRKTEIDIERSEAIKNRDYARAAELDTEQDELSAQATVVDKSESVGIQWTRLDHEGRRRWLTRQFDNSGAVVTVTRKDYVAELLTENPMAVNDSPAGEQA